MVVDNKFISQHYETQLSQLDELSKQRLLYGNWEYDISNDSLIDYDAILNIFSTKGIKGDRYITCDVARFGADRTVIMVWQGLHIEKTRTFLKSGYSSYSKYGKRIAARNTQCRCITS